MGTFLVLSLIITVLVVVPSEGNDFASNRHALEAISERYQVMADAYTSLNDAGSHSAHQIISSRYAAQQRAEALRALHLISARCASLADKYAGGRDVWVERALDTISTCYQEIVDAFARGDNASSHLTLHIVSRRYSDLAKLYTAGVYENMMQSLVVISA